MRKFLSAAGAALLLASLAGCIGSGVVKTPVPTPSAAPVFASDEEALAAAEAAYAAYVDATDIVSAEGGVNPERIKNLVTSEELERSIEEFKNLRESGNRTIGTTAFDALTLQRFDDVEVVVYACVDVSSVRLVNAEGIDITPRNRPEHVPLEIAFWIGLQGELLLNSSDVWQEASICKR